MRTLNRYVRRFAGAILAFTLGATLLGTGPNAVAQPQNQIQTTAFPKAKIIFPGNDKKPHRVTFDKQSFMVDGQRLNIWSGEIHHWRIPDLNGWRDLFQKMRANGYNAVSLYFFWGLHQTEKGGAFDFSPGTIKDLDLLMRMAAEEGLYVIARPGPYVNAEISMGGLPAFMTNEAGRLRSTDPEVLKASKAWLHAFNQIAKKHLVTNGGGAILMYQVENELLSEGDGRGDFLKELAKQVKTDGIDVPTFHNDYNLGGRFKNHAAFGTDFYAYDSYPVGFNCSSPRLPLSDSESRFRSFAPNSPHFITESQGGAFTPWGASYNASDCYQYTDESFTRQWGVHNIGNGVTAFNFYMAFGGTNWGWTGAPASGFTSYDYGAGITEDRVLTPKASVQKEIGYYQKAVPELAGMDPVKSGAPKIKGAGLVSLYARQNSNGEGSVTGNGVRTYALRQTDSNSNAKTSFTLPINLGKASGVEEKAFTNDDRDQGIEYSGKWEKITEGTASKQTLTRSKTAGDSAKFSFEGTGISVISATGTDHGEFTVQIDAGVPVKVTKAKVDSEQNKPVQLEVFSVKDLSPGKHTITVKNTGGAIVSLDAFNVFGGKKSYVEVNDSDKEFFTYKGAWEYASGKTWTSSDLEGDETFSQSVGDSVSFKFTGVGFDLVGPYSENHGSATVSVDGKIVGQTKEEVTSGPVPGKVLFSWRSPNLEAPTTHTVELKVDGKAFAGSKGQFVSLDSVRYFPTQNAIPTNGQNGDSGASPSEITWANVPQKEGTALHLHGRDALLLTADKIVGGHEMYYTTSQLFGAPIDGDGTAVQYLVGNSSDPGETVLHYKSEPKVVLGEGMEKTWDAKTGQLRLNYVYSQKPATVSITDSKSALQLRVIDRKTAVRTWIIDAMVGDKATPVGVEGVELARTAKVDGTTLALTGSTDKAGEIAVLAPKNISKVTWNGSEIKLVDKQTARGTISGPREIPPMKIDFVSASDNAQSEVNFDDSKWKVVADTKAANGRFQGPGKGQGVVLDSNHNGMYEGSVWYRARYKAASDDPTLSFTGNGGSGVPIQGKNPAFMQVWVNGKYAGSAPALGESKNFKAPLGTVKKGQEVLVAVLVHNLGQNLDWSDDGLSKQNRGLYDATLNNDGKVTWKIYGATAAGAKVSALNPSGTLYNNGGLGGETKGWHTLGIDDSKWAKATNLSAPAGVTWFRGHVKLNVPPEQDTAFRLDIEPSASAKTAGAQATIFVNGWNTGVYISDIGPQTSFTIPQAFLNLRGDNVIAFAVAAKSDGAGPKSVTLRGIHSTTLPKATGENVAVTPRPVSEPGAGADGGGSGSSNPGGGASGGVDPTAGGHKPGQSLANTGAFSISTALIAAIGVAVAGILAGWGIPSSK